MEVATLVYLGVFPLFDNLFWVASFLVKGCLPQFVGLVRIFAGVRKRYSNPVA